MFALARFLLQDVPVATQHIDLQREWEAECARIAFEKREQRFALSFRTFEYVMTTFSNQVRNIRWGTPPQDQALSCESTIAESNHRQFTIRKRQLGQPGISIGHVDAWALDDTMIAIEMVDRYPFAPESFWHVMEALIHTLQAEESRRALPKVEIPGSVPPIQTELPKVDTTAPIVPEDVSPMDPELERKFTNATRELLEEFKTIAQSDSSTLSNFNTLQLRVARWLVEAPPDLKNKIPAKAATIQKHLAIAYFFRRQDLTEEEFEQHSEKIVGELVYVGTLQDCKRTLESIEKRLS
jgi:hypothetical protein